MDIQPPPNPPTLISIYSNPPKIQNFSIPENIIFYISKNPSTAKVYSKLVYLCKYFYSKTQIITFKDTWFRQISTSWKPDKIFEIENTNNSAKIKDIPEKIWIYGKLDIVDRLNKNMASLFASKIYRSDLTKLDITNQILTFKEFKLLISNDLTIYLSFYRTRVKDDNENVVSIEKLIEYLPNLQTFCFMEGDAEPYSITSETAKNLVEIPQFVNIKFFKLLYIPEAFDFEAFFDKLKKPIKMEITFYFNSTISDNYIQRLLNFLDNLIETGLTENRPPKIRFNQMTEESCKKLQQIEKAYKEKFVN